jgi:enoyl-CoA hydratase/carnithine racemase
MLAAQTGCAKRDSPGAGRTPGCNDWHDERPGLWRCGGAGLLARYAGGLREGCKFRFLAATFGRINSTWTLPNQAGWPIAKELLFTARVVGAEEAYRIGLLNHLVPRAQLRAKTMELAKMIAANHRGAVMGVKALMLQQMGQGLEEQFNAEHEYTTHVLRGAKAKDAFPDFITRKGLAS